MIFRPPSANLRKEAQQFGIQIQPHNSSSDVRRAIKIVREKQKQAGEREYTRQTWLSRLNEVGVPCTGDISDDDLEELYRANETKWYKYRYGIELNARICTRGGRWCTVVGFGSRPGGGQRERCVVVQWDNDVLNKAGERHKRSVSPLTFSEATKIIPPGD